MKVCILGAGRSGTTSLYYFLQEIMSSLYGSNYASIYEPFLWGEAVWNKSYFDIREQWGEINSLSVDGMYWNKKIPLFVRNPEKFADNPYLASLFKPEDASANILLKFIRANGRVSLMQAACRECKFIFIIRNPLDVINSLITRFSFFGDEYHQSDLSRFLDEVNTLYACNLTLEDMQDRAAREAAYWYYMNRFALESFGAWESKPLILTHEQYVSNNEECVREITGYLGVDFRVDFLGISQEKAGPITTDIRLTPQEIETVCQYHDKYQELLSRHNIRSDATFLEDVRKRYSLADGQRPERQDNIFFGKTSNHIRNSVLREIDRNEHALLEQKKRIEQLDDSMKEKDTLLAQRQGEIAALALQVEAGKVEINRRQSESEAQKREIDRLARDSAAQKEEITRLQNEIVLNAEKISRLEAEIRTKESRIGVLQKELSDTGEQVQQWKSLASDRAADITSIQESLSYKLGFGLTFPARKMLSLLKRDSAASE